MPPAAVRGPASPTPIYVESPFSFKNIADYRPIPLVR
jgi:hypothetical protein